MMLLMFNVILNCHLINANRRNKVALGPKTAFWQFLCFLFDPGRRFSLDYTHDIGYGVFWRNIYHKMNMVIANVPSIDCASFPFRNLLENSPQFCFNIVISHHLLAISWYPDQMILTAIFAM